MYQVTIKKDGLITYSQDFHKVDISKLVEVLNASYWATVEKPEEVKEG